RREAVRLFAALAGVRLAADAVHGDGERGVCLARDRAEGHGAGGEALDDFLGRLDLLDRDRATAVFLGALQPEQATDGQQLLRLFVQLAREGAIPVVGVAAHGVLQVRYG